MSLSYYVKKESTKKRQVHTIENELKAALKQFYNLKFL